MKRRTRYRLLALAVVLMAAALSDARATIFVQCPGDTDGDAIIDSPDPAHPDARCVHLTAGDGFVNMADQGRRRLYMFGFNDVTGTPPDQVMNEGMLGANFPAPTLVMDEGDELFLSLSNVGMTIRPDLFDPHSVHWHGFPNASAIFDGVPDPSLTINQGATLTYFYKVNDAGTYMYHCHVEATEHMQMGMLGNLYVRPRQNRLPHGTALGSHLHANPDWNANRNLDDPLLGDTYAYNDSDGSTLYDVEFPVQIGSFDPDFHDASESIQPLPFANMRDLFPMLNGRGYPDTINPDPLLNTADDPRASQKLPTRIEAQQGEKILLRISDLNVTRFYTLTSLGIPMKVVGWSARLLRGPDPDGGGSLLGRDLYYDTNSVTLGGGESADVILDTAGIAPGTYFLYTTNLQYLNNNDEDLGGMMTEIVVHP